ncbi:hypothetical protein Micbo1qcDRAFT_198891 [Microdochium bolleyi]|uniref:Zn(2)-C6 fungal-type domain-containing protein n=1 Tax=Microdochium bolleyi TaxID=196109 RepID=A0A136IJZ8_9PEZI|nr:hypothetical protein Micbo1qcDRAFT_198891 [Microdochium bolleyi]
MTDSIRRRRRPAVSCTLCRRRKVRCNREVPCSNCVRSGNAPCVYDGPPPATTSAAAARSSASSAAVHPLLRRAGAGPEVSSEGLGLPLATPSPSSASTSSLPRPTATATASSVTSSVPASRDQSRQHDRHDVVAEMTTHLAGSFHMLSDAAGTPNSTAGSSRNNTTTTGTTRSTAPSIPRSVTHKGRTFGQSHWIGASLLFWDLIEMLEPHLMGLGPGQGTSPAAAAAKAGLLRCKTLARVIKARRSPAWPTPPTPDLPSRAVADALVACYLRTSERLYRVLHIPSFLSDYEAIWSSAAPHTDKDASFLIQLKLVLAIGAVTHDARFSLRASAIRWVYEAQTWLAEPKFKSRMLTLQSVQTHILLLLAQELVDISGDSVWIGAGALLRRAVHLGMHRDPAHLPRSSLLVSEMRRRLWNTILEVNIQFCVSAGAPPGLALEDADTLPPGNYDDEQLVEVTRAGDPEPKPDDCYTQTLLARALRKTLPVRLATARALNNIQQPQQQQYYQQNQYGGGPATAAYEQTLRLDGELRAAHRELCGTLEGFRHADATTSTTPSSSTASASATEAAAAAAGETSGKPAPFEVRAVDILFQRYIAFLHIPYVVASLSEKGYAFSRKAALEAALRTWYLVYPPGSAPKGDKDSTRGPGRAAASNDDDDSNVLARYTINGQGILRATVAKVPIIVAKELRMQRQEQCDTAMPMTTRPLMVLPLRPDLVAVLDGGRAWHRATLESGETNMKGFLLAHGVVAYVGYMADHQTLPDGDEELVKVLLGAMVESFEMSIPILEAQAARYGEPVGGDRSAVGVGASNSGPARNGEVGGGTGLSDAGGGSGGVVPGQDGWDPMLTDTLLGGAENDPMSWMLSDDEHVFAQGWLWG